MFGIDIDMFELNRVHCKCFVLISDVFELNRVYCKCFVLILICSSETERTVSVLY